MIHEFKLLLETAQDWQEQNHKIVLATVVDLVGSSYRRPGVRMLLNETGDAVGAVSGGCVEKEVHRQAKSVFLSGIPKMMQYDGRVRLGCEGILYVLLEPFEPQKGLLDLFRKAWQQRKPIEIHSQFLQEIGEESSLGSCLYFDKEEVSFRTDITESDLNTQLFKQELSPAQQLYIFGAEHDAVALCSLAHKLGWEVTVVAAPDEQKTKNFFPGCHQLLTPLPENIPVDTIDDQTAVLLMSHSFTKDLQYLLALQESRPAYLGLLGPAHRRERLMSELLERQPEIDPDFLALCYGPAGIHIGAESAHEIALSIMAEILSVMRKSELQPLRQKTGRIHE